MAKPKGKGKKLDNKKIEQIKALAAVGKSDNAIANELGISRNSVVKYKDQMDDLDDLRQLKKQEFIAKAWEGISDAMDLGLQKIQLAKKSTEEFDTMVENVVAICKGADMDSKDIAGIINGLTSLSNIPLAHVSTFVGTLYDKQALAQGDPTQITKDVVTWDDLD